MLIFSNLMLTINTSMASSAFQREHYMSMFYIQNMLEKSY